MKNQNTFLTDDLKLSSFLYAQGVELVDISCETGHHFFFVFTPKEKCEQLRRAYLNNAPVGGRSVLEGRETLLAEIKSRMSQAGRQYAAT